MKIVILVSLLASIAHAANPIPLWPKGAPGEKGDIGEEKDTTGPTGQLVAGKRVIRLGNVSNPTLTIYAPAKEKSSGAAVLVFPGGGFSILALDLEGTEVCEWLNSIGVTAILVKYRVPARKGQPVYAAALQDAQRAVGYVRQHAHEWSIDPAKIGVLGFSAGGHISGAVSTNFEKRNYEPVDAADSVSCRPDFAVLIYPGLLVPRQNPEKLNPEFTITANTPPTFLAQSQDDPVKVENSLFYYQGLLKAKVPAEMHLYPTGGHGYGLRRTDKMVTTWPLRAEEWMRSLKLIP